ncbi:hypothetical protein Q6272_28180, partial [Klebsiella pneumoniae]
MRSALLIFSVLAVFFAAWQSHPPHVLAPFAQVNPNTEKVAAAPQYTSRFVSTQLTDFVHSSSVTALPG